MKTLDSAQKGIALQIKLVRPHPDLLDCDQHLQQIGFIAGEQITIRRPATSEQHPMVVRVGNSTFALRQEEAACIVVE
jgi:ferrous iron transport protein A